MDRLSTKIVFTIACFLVINFCVFGQDDDKPRPISRHQFDSLVEKSIKVLQTTDIRSIQDADHIDIMLCLNTILKTNSGDFGRRFKDGQYDKLESVVEEKNYVRDITKVYTDYTYNRGMGYYFRKIKMELYGTPGLRCTFKVGE